MNFVKTHVITKTVISLTIQQNIDLSQHVTLKKFWCRVKTTNFDFQHATAKTFISLKLQPKVNFTQCASEGHLQKVQILISHYGTTARTLISLRERWKVHFTQRVSSILLISGEKCLKCWFHVNTCRQTCSSVMQHVSSKMSISGLIKLKCWFHVNTWQQGCWFHLKMSNIFNSCSP